jgi:hypothetical protein
VQQGLRDVFANQQFRRDLFVHGALRLPTSVQSDALLRTRLALATHPDAITLTVRFRIGEVGLQPEIYRPLIAGLARGPATIGALMTDPDIAPIGYAAVLQALGILCGLRHVIAALPEEGEDLRRASTDRFNAAAIQHAMLSDDVQVLASPVLGNGVAVTQFQQLFLLAAQQGHEPVAFAWNAARALNQRMVRDGTVLHSDAENLAEMQVLWEAFQTTRLPVLRQLGIV